MPARVVLVERVALGVSHNTYIGTVQNCVIDMLSEAFDVFKAMADRLQAVSSETTQVVLEEKMDEKPFDC